MQVFFAYIKKNPLMLLVGVFLCTQVIALLTPSIISWDGSVYAGMAKYLFSGGEMGVWETLRPVGFPVLLGLFWKVGIDPYVAARIVVLVSSCISLALVYSLANKIRTGSGIFAGSILALTPLFFRFSIIPMTDVLSATLALSAVYAVVEAKTSRMYWMAGLFAGLAFLFRFPHGLVVLVLGIVVVAQSWSIQRKWRDVWIAALWCSLGFLTLVLPFLIANSIAYGDPLLPMRAGAGIIAHNPVLYRQHPLFYFSSIFRSSWLYAFAVVPLVLLVMKKEFRENKALGVIFLYLLLYIGYFTLTEHKEYRYTLAFLPAAAVLAGVGLSVVFSALRPTWVRWTTLFVVVVLVLYGAYSSLQNSARKYDVVYEQIGEYFRTYEKEHGYPARIISAVPFVVARSNTRIVATLYDDWRIVLPAYEKYKDGITHVLTDTCTLEIICRFDQGCTNGKKAFEDRMKSDARVVQAGSVGSCRVMLYEVQ